MSQLMNKIEVNGVTIEYEAGLVATVEDKKVVIRYHIAPGPGYHFFPTPRVAYPPINSISVQ